MIKYILTKKEIGQHILNWESYYDNGTQHESLEEYIAKQQVKKLLNDLKLVPQDSVMIVIDKLLRELGV